MLAVEIMETKVPSDRIGAMVNVRVPTLNATKALGLIPELFKQYNTWVPVFPWPNGGKPNRQNARRRGGEGEGTGEDEGEGGSGGTGEGGVVTGSDNGDHGEAAVDVRYYIRVSAQIYNDDSDFEMLATAVLKLLE